MISCALVLKHIMNATYICMLPELRRRDDITDLKNCKFDYAGMGNKLENASIAQYM